jgi:phage terminase small subunit
MPRGGSRPGAGRKPDPNSKRQKALTARAARQGAGGSLSELKEKGAPEVANWPFGAKPAEQPPEAAKDEPKDKLPAGAPDETPLQFLLKVMRDPEASVSARMQAAIQAAPYVHAKPAPVGKKEQKNEEARKSRFTPAAPPKLAAVGGKKV